MSKTTIKVLGIVVSVVAAALVITAILLFITGKNSNPANEEIITEDIDNDKAFGNVVTKNGNIYYWKYTKASFTSDDALSGNYQYNTSTLNQLVCRNKNGEETVIVSDTGSGNICIVADRIYYQVFQDEEYFLSSNHFHDYRIKSCSLSGDEIKSLDNGELIGLIDDGKYLITEGYGNHGVFSINTSTMEKKLISDDSFLICLDDAVLCCRSDGNDTGFNDEETIYTVSGDGQIKKDLHTEYASTLTSVIEQKEKQSVFFDGTCLIRSPLIVNNTLFYIFEHVLGTASATQSSRIMCVDLNTGEANEISGHVHQSDGIFDTVDINDSDEDAIKYKEYLSDLMHLNVLKKTDYADFSDADISIFGNQTELLEVAFCEQTNSYEYVFLTYGKYSQTGQHNFSRYTFVKCALVEKNIKTGECSIVYSSTNPIDLNGLINAENNDFRLLEQTFSDIRSYGYIYSYDAETTDALNAFALLNDGMSKVLGIANLQTTMIEEQPDPHKRFTKTFPNTNSYVYHSFALVPLEQIQLIARKTLGYEISFPDELFGIDGEWLCAYRYGSDYCIGFANLDGVYGIPSTKVTDYTQLPDGRYQVSCSFKITLGDSIDEAGEYSIIAGLHEENGEKYWTIYSFNLIS